MQDAVRGHSGTGVQDHIQGAHEKTYGQGRERWKVRGQGAKPGPRQLGRPSLGRAAQPDSSQASCQRSLKLPVLLLLEASVIFLTQKYLQQRTFDPGLHCPAVAGLELTRQIKLALNS